MNREDIRTGNIQTEAGTDAPSDYINCPSAGPERISSDEDFKAQPDAKDKNNCDEHEIFITGRQIGFNNLTTDPDVIGIKLDPNNRWIKLHDKLFVSTMDMAALEEKYYRRVMEFASYTDEQKYLKKVSCLKESKETQEYSEQLSLDSLMKAHHKYSQISEEMPVINMSSAGRKAIPFQRALGVLIVQSIERTSDRETGRKMTENAYIQYFCGYETFSPDNYISHSKISELKKIFDADFMGEINEVFLKMKIKDIHLEAKEKAEEEQKKAERALERAQKNAQAAKNAVEEIRTRIGDAVEPEEIKKAEEKVCTAEKIVKKLKDRVSKAVEKVKDLVAGKTNGQSDKTENSVESEESSNAGSISIDATCNPGNIKFPMDFDLLNDARKTTESILTSICHQTGTEKPRTYKKTLQNEVKDLSKKKKKTEEDIRSVIKDMLQAIERNYKYIDEICKETGYEFTYEETYELMVVKTIYGQQKYMYEENVHRVPNRIVSLSIAQVRPIVRGKTTNPVEFGPKTEISIDGNGFVRLENFSFDAFNEGNDLIDTIERFKKRTGYYPEVVRCDQIYRTKENLQFCKAHGIRLSGPKLGRKTKDEDKLREQIKVEKADMVDRIEVERQFSREKHCWGVGRIMERTADRMEHAVGMAIFLNNLVPIGCF